MGEIDRMGASTPEIGHQIGVGGEFERPGRSFETGVARAFAWEARDRETVELVRPIGIGRSGEG